MRSEEVAAKERAQLEEGWSWLKQNGNSPEADAFFNERWLPKLREYERLYGMDGEKIDTDILPPPSPWIEELRNQLLLGGIAGVDPLDRNY